VTLSIRDRAAGVIALAALGLGLLGLLVGRYDLGVDLVRGEAMLLVGGVRAHGLADRNGVEPGMVVASINGIGLLALPQPVYPEGVIDGMDPETGESVEPLRYEPARPTPIRLSQETMDELLAMDIEGLELMPATDLAPERTDSEYSIYNVDWWGWPRPADAFPALVIGVGILLFGAWWLASGRAAASLAGLAIPLAVASAVPFLVRPLTATLSQPAIAVGGVLMPLAVVPLGLALADLVESPTERRLALWAVAGFGAVAAVFGAVQAFVPPAPSAGALWGLLVGGIAIVPALAAAGILAPPTAAPESTSSGRLLASSEVVVAGVTPLVALATDSYPYLFPMAVWVLILAVAGRFTIRPLARMATRATLQRDLVVAATEAERARVAADIHDDALQELSLLVRRLDSQGDEEGAEIARQVADRLRAICGDLRLPILDDLGVGPALDWLVLRIERLAGGEVRLERSDGARPPADVELAFFRVAQEALANAVKHGRPPIVVRYRSTPAGASLSVDDAGPGIAPEAGAAAEREGRFGLLNMQQRAEAIGAILDVRRWPGGGTHVALEWRPR
jgi:signal transduction histidine kinase